MWSHETMKRAVLTTVILCAAIAVASIAQERLSGTLRIRLAERNAERARVTVVARPVSPKKSARLTRVHIHAKSRREAIAAARSWTAQRKAQHSLGGAAKSGDPEQGSLITLAMLLASTQPEVKIIHEQAVPRGGGYEIDAELPADSDVGIAAKELRSLGCSNFRLVALLPETVDGQPTMSPLVETALVDALRDRRFHVFDWNFVTKQRPLQVLARSVLSGSSENRTAAVQLGTNILANVILAGRVSAAFSEDNEGILSYRASTDVRAIRVDTGEILAAKSFEQKGFGNTRAKAAREALSNLAKDVAAEMPAAIMDSFGQYHLTVELDGASVQRAGEIQAMLTGLPGVKAVTPVSTSDGLAFQVFSQEKPVALAAKIEAASDYRVLDFQ
jgi:hypothetical protein